MKKETEMEERNTDNYFELRAALEEFSTARNTSQSTDTSNRRRLRKALEVDSVH